MLPRNKAKAANREGLGAGDAKDSATGGCASDRLLDADGEHSHETKECDEAFHSGCKRYRYHLLPASGGPRKSALGQVVQRW
ncbi:MAG: hypothetical protein H0V84_06995 [Actinobacteria bacterium]|nr:hypothetical protein [Actinomycetota bacterium]